tara:strand:- start:629 stop:1168 length:540 start_codon:yes stop_codon:yes gene_type:complete
MQLDECFYLGYFSKTIGTKGELALKLDVDSPSDYINLKQVLVQMNSTDHQLVPFFAVKAELQNNGNLRCQFESIDDANFAKTMVGKSVFLPLSKLKPLGENQFYFHEIIGYQVTDLEFGLIGPVSEVLEFNHSNLLVVKKEEKEILIPITDEIILKVDKVNQSLQLKCPEGLIELYLEN